VRPGAARAVPAPRAAGFDLSEREFAILRELVVERTGIALGPHKRALLQGRLAPRLRALGLRTFAEYRRAFAALDPASDEAARFVNAVTTTKTEFFREPRHFAYLTGQWLPRALERAARGRPRRVRIWSAACSSGEEPYSLAMTVMDALAEGPAWDVRILASDINTDVLRRAAAGVYRQDAVSALPRTTLRRHFLRGRGASTGLVRVRPEVRGLVAFRRINLVDGAWLGAGGEPIRTRFDAVFCRNVLMYFDRSTQQRVLRRLAEHVADGGVLVLGHSEGVRGLLSGLRHLGSAIYLKETVPPKETAHAGDHPHR
jgi:chemotaxis protein methyltransferase CheR